MNLNLPLEKTSSRNNRQFRANSCWRGLWLFFSLFFAPVIGHCSISIMPMEAKLQVTKPGARLTQSIEVYNSGADPIHVTSSVSDWSMNLSGQKQYHDAGTQPLSCAPWIEMNPMQFSLAPGKSMQVRYSVTPPAELAQEHWAMIFFTARAVPKARDKGLGIIIQTRMGCKVLVAPTLKAPLQGKITQMALENFASPDVPSTNISKVKIDFVNPNAVSVRLDGTVEVRNTNGEVVAKGTLTPEKALVLVDATRELWAQLDKALPPGTYQIKAAIDYGGKELVGGVLKTEVKAPETLVPKASELETLPELPSETLENGAGVQ